MSKHQVFAYRTLEDLAARAQALGVSLPLSSDLSTLSHSLSIAGHTLSNRIALQPMEGTDGGTDGSPGPLTFRRYRRFAEGGASLIWFEAVAVGQEGRASAHQLMLTEENLPLFQRIVAETKEAGLRQNGFAPLLIMQATHSGRYSKPQGTPEPLIAYQNPVFEQSSPIPAERILTDDQLQEREAWFGHTARLAQAAGFDGMDVKACHRYLACELLSAFNRPGRYGGPFENRIRFLQNAYRAAAASTTGSFFLTSRLNVYDGFPYPYGFGVTEESGLAPVLEEGIRLVGALQKEFSIPLVNVTIGNPYVNPHVNRPYDRGNYVPNEHPLQGLSRMMDCVAAIQHAHPGLPVMGSAFSYPRQFSPNLAAGMVEGGHAALAGFGRLAFAYPDFARDILQKGALDKNKVCVACGQCAVLLRHGCPAGCVVRDGQTYQRYEDVQA